MIVFFLPSFFFFYQSHQPLTYVTSYQGNDETDELRALRAELDRFRQENEQLRQRLLLSSNERIGTLTSEQNIQATTTTASAAANGMPVSTYTLQFSDRERKLQDQIVSLEKVTKTRI